MKYFDISLIVDSTYVFGNQSDGNNDKNIKHLCTASFLFKVHSALLLNFKFYSFVIVFWKHTLGVISQVKKSLNAEWTLMECNFFSKVTNQDGARWTFFRRTHLPFLEAVLMALSAWVKPSSDPMAILVIVLPSSVAKSSTRPNLKKKKYD